MIDYKPAHTPSPSCEPFNWEDEIVDKSQNTTSTERGQLATQVPHRASARLCSCMTETLQCVSNPKGPGNGTIVQKLCQQDRADDSVCKGVTENYSDPPVYGAYAGCTTHEQVSWILNRVFLSRSNDSEACTSNNGTLQTPVAVGNQSYGCKEMLRQVGPEATDFVSVTPLEPLFSMDGIALQKDGLPTSSKLGVGLGVPAGVILSVAAGVLLQRRRAKARSEKELEAKDQVVQKAELAADEAKSPPRAGATELDADLPERRELEGVVAQELGGENERVEADSGGAIYELPGNDEHIGELDSAPRSAVSKVDQVSDTKF
jgi:hypothetical protein